MAFELNSRDVTDGELAGIIRRELRQAVEELDKKTAAGVHAARRSVKKVRAIVALLESFDGKAVRKDGRRLRAVGRTLSELRDAEVVLTTWNSLRKGALSRLPIRM